MIDKSTRTTTHCTRLVQTARSLSAVYQSSVNNDTSLNTTRATQL